MNYGFFDDAEREYVITNPKTPVKWINYLGTLAFGGFIDQTGGALLCKQDPALNRITKYIAQMPAGEFKGTTLYLRVKTEDGYGLIAPFFVPCLTPLERYECRVGLGYNRYLSRVDGLEVEVTVFVPLDGEVELRDIRVRNVNTHAIRVDVIPVVEYTHFDALKQLTNADWVPQTMQSDCLEEPGGVKTLLQYAFMRKEFAVNFFSSSLPVSSYETDRKLFLGENEYGSWSAPVSLLSQAELSNSQARRGDNIAALLHHLGELQPGEERQLITILGQAQSYAAAQPVLERYRDPAEVVAAFVRLNESWDALLSRQQVMTPDAALNSMLNVHNPRQCFTTFNWSRYLSLYQLGYGARGIGFRDSSQDVLGVLSLMPGQARGLLRKLLKVQKRNGSAMHQFNPLSMEATAGDSSERDDRPHYYSDDHLWSILAVTAYLKETGDFSFLEEEVPFYEKDRAEKPLESASAWQHLSRGLAFTRQDTGAHGLPLLGFADWNDTINLAAGAESALTAGLYGKALLEMIELARLRNDTTQAAQWEQDYETMRQRVDVTTWDGNWYLSYYDADGTPLGSKINAAGQLYAYGQAWPVISGFADIKKAEQALEAVYQRLNTRHGIKLSTPGFQRFNPAQGGITTYPPGAKENCGIFLHINPWVIIAETLAGHAERAYAYYAQINPAAKNEQADLYECEPYVYPQNILGDEHPQFGLARNSWLSGTAAWMYVAGMQYILGIQPTYCGLRVNPCIPPQWEGFSVQRVYRGATYAIEVRNPQHTGMGVRSMSVDGRAVAGNVIPIFEDGIHQVVVTL